MGPADPYDQTQDAAVDAMHAANAEPAASVVQMSQPAAAVRRCVCLHENRNYALLMQQRL